MQQDRNPDQITPHKERLQVSTLHLPLVTLRCSKLQRKTSIQLYPLSLNLILSPKPSDKLPSNCSNLLCYHRSLSRLISIQKSTLNVTDHPLPAFPSNSQCRAPAFTLCLLDLSCRHVREKQQHWASTGKSALNY